ncbi:MAG TPA: phospholipase D-like domain-containing protein [Candidatus Babeliales bacterium]|nr:phospholipase D-like domain-containing protein [Candidatus Babeliales bacterium]
MKTKVSHYLFCILLSYSIYLQTSIEVYFSPDDNLTSHFVDYINNEHKSIDIAIYTLTSKEIVKALIVAHKRGVKVNVLVDEYSLTTHIKFNAIDELIKSHIPLYLFNPKQFYNSGSGRAQLFYNAYPALSNYMQIGEQPVLPGGKVKLGGRPLMHHKFCLFNDNDKIGSTVWTGSFNFTYTADKYNQENAVVISDNEIYRSFKKQFEIMKRHRSTRLTRYTKKDYGTEVKEIFFTPDQQVTERLIELIDDEQEKIDIAIYSLSHKEITEALIRAKERGVDITILIDHGDHKKLAHAGVSIYSFDPAKYNAGIEKEGSTNKENMYDHRSHQNILMHNKFCIFYKNKDNKKLVWTGSMNFTYSSTYTAQNNVIILNDSHAITKFEKQFNLMKENRSKNYIPKKTFIEDVTEKLSLAFRSFTS